MRGLAHFMSQYFQELGVRGAVLFGAVAVLIAGVVLVTSLSSRPSTVLQRMIDAAEPGETITLKPGIYQESIYISESVVLTSSAGHVQIAGHVRIKGKNSIRANGGSNIEKI